MAHMIDASTVLASSSYLTPREKMMLAKLAIIEDEDRERDERRERRRTRRASSIAKGIGLDRPTSPSSISSMGSSSRKSRSSGSVPRPKYPTIKAKSWAEPEPTTHFTPINTQISIMPALPPTSIHRNQLALPGPSSGPQGMIRRRSSKVRFSDELQNSSSSLPSIPDEGEISPRGSMSSSRGSMSSSRGSMSHRVPVPRFSTVSGSSAQTDPFELQTMEMMQRPSFAMSITSEESESGVDAFLPKPLGYPKVSKALWRLSTELQGSNSGREVDQPESSRDSLNPRSASAPAGTLPQAVEMQRTISSASTNLSTAYPASSSASRPSYASTGISEAGRTNTTCSSISLDMPNCAEIIAHLLPQARPTQAEMNAASPRIPIINRSGWVDGDGSISPKSSPMTLSPDVMVNQPSPRSPVVTRSDSMRLPSEEISPKSMPISRFAQQELVPSTIAPPSHPLPAVPTAVAATQVPSLEIKPIPPPRPTRSLSRSAPRPPVINHNDHLDLLPPTTRISETNPHARTESDTSLGDVLDFPVPPERRDSLQYKMTLESAKRVANMLSTSKTYEAISGINSTRPAAVDSRPSSSSLDVFEELAEEEDDHVRVEVVQNSSAYSPPGEENKAATPKTHQGIAMCESPIQEERLVVAQGVRPDSPPLSEMMKRLPRRKTRIDSDGEETDSDLDISAPLVQAALKSKILSPNSRLLNTDNQRSATGSLRRQNSSLTSLSLRSGRVLTSGQGWSGSESEEETWSTTVRSVVQRKVSSSMSSYRSNASSISGSTASIVEAKSITPGPVRVSQPPQSKPVQSIPTPKKTLFRAARIDSLHLSAASFRKRVPVPIPIPMPLPTQSSVRPPMSVLPNRESILSASSTTSTAGSDQLETPQTEQFRQNASPTIKISLDKAANRISSDSIGSSHPGDFPWGRAGSGSPSGSLRSLKSSPRHVAADLTRQISPASISLTPLSPSTLKQAPLSSPESTISASPTTPAATPPRTISRMPPPSRKVDEWGAFEKVLSSADDDDDKYTRYERPSTVGRARTSYQQTPVSRNSYSSATWTPGSIATARGSISNDPPSPSRAACTYIPTSRRVTSPRKAIPIFSSASETANLSDLTPRLGNGWRVPSPLFGSESEASFSTRSDDDGYLLGHEMSSLVRA